MNQIVPWVALVALSQPYARGAPHALGGPLVPRGHAPHPLAAAAGNPEMLDETTNLRCRDLVDKHQLAPRILALANAGVAQQGLMPEIGTIVEASIIAAPSSTKNKQNKRDPEVHQTKKGNQWHFGMKAYLDAEPGRGHTRLGTAANVNDVTQASGLLHGAETGAWGDGGYQGVCKREESKDSQNRWAVAVWPGRHRGLKNLSRQWHQLLEKAEKLKVNVRIKAEPPLRVVKQQFDYAKVRYRGLAKNTVRLTLLLR